MFDFGDWLIENDHMLLHNIHCGDFGSWKKQHRRSLNIVRHTEIFVVLNVYLGVCLTIK